ncbi:MAG: hypothetical protein ACPGR7_02965 [Flavobacteriaceae bacterium]|nr:hypothetical protein [Flavobacteriaceae bacterium]
MDLQQRALEFETKKFRSRNDKIIASKEAKELILGLNEIYKKTQDQTLMDLMKRLTVIKRKVEKRLNGRLHDLV